jgi:hypothetical protein
MRPPSGLWSLLGAVAAAFYTLVAVISRLFVPNAPPTPFIYYVAHVLKLAGGATGGWLAQRSAVPANYRTGRASTSTT